MTRKPKSKIIKKSRSFNLTEKASVDTKIGLMGLHLDCIFDRGVNFKERIIIISQEIDFPAWDFFDAALTELESQGKGTVTVKINSFGGSVYEALAIVGRMKASKVTKIVTEGHGAVMSAATLILAAGDYRKMSKYAFFMHHESSYGTEGRHSQIKAAVAQAEKEERLWANYMAEFTKKDSKFWMSSGVSVDAYFNAPELLKMGVIDEII